MTAVTRLLIACAAAALPLAAAMAPLTAAAQSGDAAYCTAMTNADRSTVPKAQTPTATVPVAIAKCEAGDPAAGIPALEQALKDAQVTLPRRG